MPNPNHDQWTATNAQEALDLLDAARMLIEARMLTLHPGDYKARRTAQKTQPARLALSLDLDPEELPAATERASTGRKSAADYKAAREKTARSRVIRSLGWD